MFAEGEGLESGGHLIDLLHSFAGGTAAGKHNDIVFNDLAGFDGVDGGGFGGEDFGRAEVMESLIGIDQGGVDGCALDDGTFGGEVADGKAHSRGEAAGAGAVRRHNDVIGIDAVLIEAVDGSVHLERARPFLEAGIPTYVDKPFACSVFGRSSG